MKTADYFTSDFMEGLKKYFIASLLFCLAITTQSFAFIDPGKAYLFAYTIEDGNRHGLYMAWSTDKINWHPIGPGHAFVYCDYGSWGTEKRMNDPVLYRDTDGLWHAVWGVNDQDPVFAYASSQDLIHWQPQSYPVFNTQDPIINPQILRQDGKFIVNWKSGTNKNAKGFSVTTMDFKSYSELKPISNITDTRVEIDINGQERNGSMHQVEWAFVEKLIQAKDLAAYNHMLYSQTTDQDKKRFAGLETLSASVKVLADRKKEISDKLIGVFYEDINYAADGGIYGELIQNRDFEYHPSERKYKDPNWNALTAWDVTMNHSIDSTQPIHINNKHYLVLQPSKEGAVLRNMGYGGISIKDGEKYDLSLFAKAYDGSNVLDISLKDSLGNSYGSTKVKVDETSWEKHKAVIRANEGGEKLFLEIVPQNQSKIALDMISLFPRNTFKNRTNGLRADLAQVIADIDPKFVRFPGGCVAHGDGLDNIYNWKHTVGPLESRIPQRNIWGYHQSVGLGYFEYFQFCEDIDAEPIPIIAAGVPCQNSSTGGAGQQCGLPMEEMDEYIQDILDLIQWANGPADSKWGSVRAQAGHPKPFNLKYIGIGNEDLISDVFIERFTMIYNAIQEAHPEIVVIGTAGPFSSGSDYDKGWELANQLDIPLVDEHYYQPPGWFIHNQDYYDAYDRSKSKVYLGEYAAHLPGRPNNIETALSEAIYLTSIERNGDIVEMSSYAPLLAKEGSTQWNPDLIYFDNSEVHLTPGYYVQKLFSNHDGTTYFDHQMQLSNTSEDVKKRVAISSVLDKSANELIIKMVNLLPVAVDTKLDLSGFNLSSEVAEVYTLSGHPDDENAIPVRSELGLNTSEIINIKPYSLQVIRIKLQ